MAYYLKQKRSFSAPSVYRVGGDLLHGMDHMAMQGALDTAVYLENLWRTKDGCMSRRPGYICIDATPEQYLLQRKVVFAGQAFYICLHNGRYCIGVHMGNDWHWRDAGQKKPCIIETTRRLFMITETEWIFVDVSGEITILSAIGYQKMVSAAAFSNNSTQAFANWPFAAPPTTTPLIRAGSTPHGSGQMQQPINMLSPLVQESFCYTDQDKQAKRNRFCTALGHMEVIGELPVDGNGSVEEITEEQQRVRVTSLQNSAYLELRLCYTDQEGNTYSEWVPHQWMYRDNINANAGAFWIHMMQDKALAYDGEDNVRITYRREMSEFAKHFASLVACTQATLHGVAGYKDRLFISGNQQYPGRVWYSGMDNMLYFGELQYLQVGDSPVRILAGQDTRMSVLCDDGAYLVSGEAAKEQVGGYALDAVFTVSSALALPAPVINSNAVIAGNEILFMTKRGVCAISTSGVLDERCVLLRSGCLDGLLDPSQNYFLATYQDYLLISNGEGHIYLLDLLRKVATDDRNHAGFGYEAYLWTNMPAVSIWQEGDSLCFCNDTFLYQLQSGQQLSHFHDEKSKWVGGSRVTESLPIEVVWQTPVCTGKAADKCTLFDHLAVWMCTQPDAPTSLSVWCSMDNGDWQLVCGQDGYYGMFHYGKLNYRGWTYRTSVRGHARRIQLRGYHAHQVRFRLQSDAMDERFHLKQLQLEFR